MLWICVSVSTCSKIQKQTWHCYALLCNQLELKRSRFHFVVRSMRMKNCSMKNDETHQQFYLNGWPTVCHQGFKWLTTKTMGQPLKFQSPTNGDSISFLSATLTHKFIAVIFQLLRWIRTRLQPSKRNVCHFLGSGHWEIWKTAYAQQMFDSNGMRHTKQKMWR